MPKTATAGQMPARFRLKCLTLAKDPRYEKIALILQKQFYEIGVDMEIEALPARDLISRLRSGNFDLVLMERTSGRSLAWTYLSFHSSQNPAGYTAADKVLDRLRQTTADSGVRTAVSDLQQIFHDDPPAIFIFWPKVARVVSSKFVVPDEGGKDRHEQILALASGHVRSMRRITSRFVLLIASAAIAPLVVYGVISLINLRNGTISSVREGSQRVADQVAEQIGQYVAHNTRVLRSLGLTLRGIYLEPWQQSRVIKDYLIDFPEFREISFFGAGGRLIATSRPGDSTLSIPAATDVDANGIYIAPLQLDDDGLPRTTIAVRVVPAGSGGWLGSRRDCTRRAVANGRPRPRRHAGVCASHRRGPAPHRARQSEQEASRGVEQRRHRREIRGTGVRP